MVGRTSVWWTTDELMDMNDTGWSFVQIAKYIERNWNPDDKETL